MTEGEFIERVYDIRRRLLRDYMDQLFRFVQRDDVSVEAGLLLHLELIDEDFRTAGMTAIEQEIDDAVE